MSCCTVCPTLYFHLTRQSIVSSRQVVSSKMYSWLVLTHILRTFVTHHSEVGRDGSSTTTKRQWYVLRIQWRSTEKSPESPPPVDASNRYPNPRVPGEAGCCFRTSLTFPFQARAVTNGDLVAGSGPPAIASPDLLTNDRTGLDRP